MLLSTPMFDDVVLNGLIEKYPAPSWVDRSDFLFEDLVETVISQQLSGKAADSIFKKFKQLFQQDPLARFTAPVLSPVNSFPSPEDVLHIEQGLMRTAGLSNAKETYIRNVAEAFVDQRVIVDDIRTMSDKDIIAKLTEIKGIGKWSAEMILIFTLNRPDVFSIGDLGLRNAIKNLYGIADIQDVLKLSETWSPNRSHASWYLWRSLENK